MYLIVTLKPVPKLCVSSLQAQTPNSKHILHILVWEVNGSSKNDMQHTNTHTYKPLDMSGPQKHAYLHNIHVIIDTVVYSIVLHMYVHLDRLLECSYS